MQTFAYRYQNMPGNTVGGCNVCNVQRADGAGKRTHKPTTLQDQVSTQAATSICRSVGERPTTAVSRGLSREASLVISRRVSARERRAIATPQCRSVWPILAWQWAQTTRTTRRWNRRAVCRRNGPTGKCPRDVGGPTRSWRGRDQGLHQQIRRQLATERRRGASSGQIRSPTS